MKKPIHKMGAHCGFDLYEDGSIRPAPQYIKQFDDVAAQQAAVNNLLKMITQHCTELLLAAEQISKDIWEQVMDDYSLSSDNRYIYNHATKKISVAPKST